MDAMLFYYQDFRLRKDESVASMDDEGWEFCLSRKQTMRGRSSTCHAASGARLVL